MGNAADEDPNISENLQSTPAGFNWER
jgi:hypothetical protein